MTPQNEKSAADFARRHIGPSQRDIDAMAEPLLAEIRLLAAESAS